MDGLAIGVDDPARALYRARGFRPCGPFADYRPSPNSTYPTIDLTPVGRPVS